jgi:glycosyltransferase involved in cell wall biosynthesis
LCTSDSNKKKVTFFLENIDEGGAERAVIELANYVAIAGYKVDLIVGWGRSSYREEISPRVNFIDLKCRNKLRLLLRLSRYLYNIRPSIIMSALDNANLILLVAKKISGYRGRLVISQRAALSASFCGLPRWRIWIMKKLMKALFPVADAIISNSKYAASELIKTMPEISKKTFTIHNSVDITKIERLAKNNIDQKDAVNNSSASLVIVGSLKKRKNIELCLRSFKIVSLHRKAHLNIIGDGPERNKLEKMAQELGLKDKVYFRGFDKNPFRWMAKASVLISSSAGEGCSNVILQAMATNCPIVATDCPGDTAELLGHGQWGRLVPIGDAQRMATAIIETLDKPNKKNTKAYIRQFSVARYLDSYIKVFFRSTNKNSPGCSLVSAPVELVEKVRSRLSTTISHIKPKI